MIKIQWNGIKVWDNKTHMWHKWMRLAYKAMRSELHTWYQWICGPFSIEIKRKMQFGNITGTINDRLHIATSHHMWEEYSCRPAVFGAFHMDYYLARTHIFAFTCMLCKQRQYSFVLIHVSYFSYLIVSVGHLVYVLDANTHVRFHLVNGQW